MSWQQYIDSSLVGTGQVKEAAIVGQDCSVWSASEGFIIDPTEARKLVSHFSNGASDAMANGIHINKVKYLFIKKDEFTSGEEFRLLIGKKGPTGVSIFKTNKALIVGVYGEGTQPGQCNDIVVKLGQYLIDAGY